MQTVKWYVPTDSAKYADRNIDHQYKQRLYELEHPAASNFTSNDTDLEAVLNLDALPAHKEHLNKTEREALDRKEAQHLREVSEAIINKAEHLGRSLQKAASDTQTIEEGATRAVKGALQQFKQRADKVETSVVNLQAKMNNGQASGDFRSSLDKTMGEVKALRDNEMQSLDTAHHNAREAAKNAARGAEDEARKQAEHVWDLTDRMARKDQFYQDLSNKLQNRAETAANVVQDHAETLARRTEDHLQNHLSQARDEVRKTFSRRFKALHAVQQQFEEMQSRSQTFLAQSAGMPADDTRDFNPAPFAFLALVGVACGCVFFFVKRRSPTTQLPQKLLGYNPPLLG